MGDAGPEHRRFRVVAAEPSHLEGMARCHVACFPAQFMSHVGGRYTRAFYQAYLEDPKGLAFVAVSEEDGRVVGLVGGGDADIRARFLRRAPGRFLGTLLVKCVTDRVVRSKVFEALAQKLRLSRKRKEEPARPAPGEAPRAMLQVVCVLPEARGAGAAPALVEAFRKACRDAGYRTMELTVATDNARALGFYRKTGWQVAGQDVRNTSMWRSAGD